MKHTNSPFVFDKDALNITQEDYSIIIPGGIQSKAVLLSFYEEQGKFPYFGHNWDALDECLYDFSWIKQKRILIVHEDLPLSENYNELRSYIGVLQYALKRWQMEAEERKKGTFLKSDLREHELIVSFPSSVKDRVSKILTDIQAF